MKRILQLILVCCCLSTMQIHAQQVQERLIYTTYFQDWAALGSSATETVLEKQTNFSNETLVFNLKNINIKPTGEDTIKFTYAPATIGYAMCEKNVDTYINFGATEVGYQTIFCALRHRQGAWI